jgi:excisionase family DNA binding protein
LQKLLTVQEVADRLGLSKSKTYDLVMNGQIKSMKIGRNRRVLSAALDEFVERMAAESMQS